MDSFPELNLFFKDGGRERYRRLESIERKGSAIIISIIAGILFSTRGASQRPAKKPRTTLGSAAIISITGFIIPFNHGFINRDV